MIESRPDDVHVLFFTTRSSGVGRRMESVVASLQSRHRDRVALRRVDADVEGELVSRLGVSEIPSVLFVQAGRLVRRVQGRATLDELEQALARCT